MGSMTLVRFVKLNFIAQIRDEIIEGLNTSDEEFEYVENIRLKQLCLYF